jgi:type IV pilus assembly protein PilX
MTFASSPRFASRNRGAVLFVALIMLLLLTLLGVTGMQVTMLQERMSGNFRAQQQSFERSEGKVSEGRDSAADPLWAYDNIPQTPISMTNDHLPWDAWLTDPVEQVSEQFLQGRRLVAGAGAARGKIVSDDPQKDVRYYVVSAQEKDPASDADNAAWTAVQTIYVF